MSVDPAPNVILCNQAFVCFRWPIELLGWCVRMYGIDVIVTKHLRTFIRLTNPWKVVIEIATVPLFPQYWFSSDSAPLMSEIGTEIRSDWLDTQLYT